MAVMTQQFYDTLYFFGTLREVVSFNKVGVAS